MKVNYRVTSAGRVYSEKEWELARTEDGRITSTIKDHLLGIISAYGGREIKRGDIFDFELEGGILQKKYIKKGEKIGRLYSNDLKRLIVQLEGELAVEKAMYDVYATGEKPQTVSEAQSSLTLAKENFDIQKKLLERQKKLYEDSLIAPQDYDKALNDYEVSRINYELAQAKLTSISTGEKPEQLKLSKEKIILLENQIRGLKDRQGEMEITSPFSGILIHKKGRNAALEILANVVDTSRFIIVTPVQLKELKYVKLGQKVTLKLFNSDCEMEATIVEIDNAIQVINGKQAVYATAIMDNNNKCAEILPGILSMTVINCGELTVFEYSKRVMEGLFYR
ncbi:MAG: HlyD family efflux transporter periplasmic adaptor subunit [Cytophagaceae bacterium]|nr:HlyD family efflux transporter periplasmic adaptor subunit [Cytophagaceae bacterium]